MTGIEPASSHETSNPTSQAGFSVDSTIEFCRNIVYNQLMNTTNLRLEYQRDEHRIHLIVYHLIWCPKRRKPILVGEVKERCQQLIVQKCQDQGWLVLSLAIHPDHIHVCVRVWPSDSAADVVKALKGATSFRLRREFRGVVSKMPALWTRSYFASTAVNVSKETIERYMEAQKGL
jgi:putative transposase